METIRPIQPPMYIDAMAIPGITGRAPATTTSGVADVPTPEGVPADAAPVAQSRVPTAAGKLPPRLDAKLDGAADKKLREALTSLKETPRAELPAALQRVIVQLAKNPRQDVVEALRLIQSGIAVSSPPNLAEAILDGIADGALAQALGLAQTIAHPIQTLEELSHLPSTLATLLRHSPEAWDQFRALPAEAQVRRATDLVTQALIIAGTFKTAGDGVDTLPPLALPALVLQPSGVLAVEWVAVSAKSAAALGPATALVLQMHWMRGRGAAEPPPAIPAQTTVIRGPSGRTSVRKFLEKNWEKSTLGTVRTAIEHHLNKHDPGMHPVEHTQRALRLFESESATRQARTTLQGLPAVFVKDSQLGAGLFTPGGRIIWFQSKR